MNNSPQGKLTNEEIALNIIRKTWDMSTIDGPYPEQKLEIKLIIEALDKLQAEHLVQYNEVLAKVKIESERAMHFVDLCNQKDKLQAEIRGAQQRRIELQQQEIQDLQNQVEKLKTGCNIREHNGLERLLMPGPYMPNPEFGQDVAFVAIKLDSQKAEIERLIGVNELVQKIREIARPMGWAIGTHGSMKRDIDLIAVPWIEDAKGNWEVFEAIRDGIGADHSSVLGKTSLPHGRIALMVIRKGAVSYKGKNGMDDWNPPAIDISFVDPRNAEENLSLYHSAILKAKEALEASAKGVNRIIGVAEEYANQGKQFARIDANGAIAEMYASTAFVKKVHEALHDLNELGEVK